jgi:multiple sugar transport system permease protein
VGSFVGLTNFAKAWDDSIFQTAFRNTFFYTFWATLFKLVLGMWLALLLNRHFKFKRIVRASMLLPFIIPTVLSTFAWRWMFDPTFSVLNWSLYNMGFIVTKLPFLSDGTYAMWCAIAVNTWRGMPFFAITLLAGLQTISPDLHEAASLDGANGWYRFWHVTWPLLKPVTLVVVVFSIIQTFSDFQLIYVLTGGGPANSTHLLATYAYQLGVGAGRLSEGAAMSLFMFPVLFAVVWIQLRYLRRMEGA